MKSHLGYLLRDGASGPDQDAKLFGPDADTSPCKDSFLERTIDDRHAFRLILSPENGHELDLEEYARKVMKQVSKDVRSPLDWVAVTHQNTDNPHVHIVLRGRHGKNLDQDLFLRREYITDGLRRRAQEIATQELGPRTAAQIQETRARQVTQHRFTSLDRRLVGLSSDHLLKLNSTTSDPLLRQRLEYLSSLKLVTMDDKRGLQWRLHPSFEESLRALSRRNDIIKRMHQAGQKRSADWRYEAPDTPVCAKVLHRGIADERFDKHFIIAEGLDGRTYYFDQDKDLTDAATPGSIIVLAKDEPTGKAALLSSRPLAESVHYIGPTALDHPELISAINKLEKRKGSFAHEVAAFTEKRNAFLEDRYPLYEMTYPRLRELELEDQVQVYADKYGAQPLSVELNTSHRGVLRERIELESGNYFVFESTDNSVALIPSSKYLENAFEEKEEFRLSAYESKGVVRYAVSPPLLSQEELRSACSEVAAQTNSAPLELTPGTSLNGLITSQITIQGRDYATFRPDEGDWVALLPASNSTADALENQRRINVSAYVRNDNLIIHSSEPKLSEKELRGLAADHLESQDATPLAIVAGSKHRGHIKQAVEYEGRNYHLFLNENNQATLIPELPGATEALENSHFVELNTALSTNGELRYRLDVVTKTQKELLDYCVIKANEHNATPLQVTADFSSNIRVLDQLHLDGRDYAVIKKDEEPVVAIIPATKETAEALSTGARLHINGYEKDGQLRTWISPPRLSPAELVQSAETYTREKSLDVTPVELQAGLAGNAKVLENREIEGRTYAVLHLEDNNQVALLQSTKETDEALEKGGRVHLSAYEKDGELRTWVSPPRLSYTELVRSAEDYTREQGLDVTPVEIQAGLAGNARVLENRELEGRTYAVLHLEDSKQLTLIQSTKETDEALDLGGRVHLSAYEKEGELRTWVSSPRLTPTELVHAAEAYKNEKSLDVTPVELHAGLSGNARVLENRELEGRTYAVLHLEDSNQVALLQSTKETDEALAKSGRVHLSAYEKEGELRTWISSPRLTQDELNRHAKTYAKHVGSEPIEIKDGKNYRGEIAKTASIEGRDYLVFLTRDNKVAILPATAKGKEALHKKASVVINARAIDGELRTFVKVVSPNKSKGYER